MPIFIVTPLWPSSSTVNLPHSHLPPPFTINLLYYQLPLLSSFLRTQPTPIHLRSQSSIVNPIPQSNSGSVLTKLRSSMIEGMANAIMCCKYWLGFKKFSKKF